MLNFLEKMEYHLWLNGCLIFYEVVVLIEKNMYSISCSASGTC
jgi:hypothetical protein